MQWDLNELNIFPSDIVYGAFCNTLCFYVTQQCMKCISKCKHGSFSKIFLQAMSDWFLEKKNFISCFCWTSQCPYVEREVLLSPPHQETQHLGFSSLRHHPHRKDKLPRHLLSRRSNHKSAALRNLALSCLNRKGTQWC